MKSTRSYRRVSLYILQEFLLSFLVAFLFFFFIFFVNQMLLLARDILTRDVAPFDVVRLIWYSLPSIVALSFPFGALVGALMAIGRLSSDNEILALQAAGVPLLQMALPLLTAGILLSVVSFVMNDYFLPVGTINFGTLYRELLYANPALELEPHSINRYQDSIMITGAVDEGTIEGLLIIERDDRDARRVILAGRARFAGDENDGVISLELSDVFSHRVDSRNREQYEWLSAEQMEYNILLRDIAVGLRSPGPREMSSVDVFREIELKRAALSERRREHELAIAGRRRDLYLDYRATTQRYAESDSDPASWYPALARRLEAIERDAARAIVDRSLQIYEIEYHKKFSIPFACIAFTLLAFPVGLTTRRSGRSVGFGLGLLVSVIYWAMLIGGQTLGVQRTEISPLLAMWAPNIVIVTGAVAFLLLRLRR